MIDRYLTASELRSMFGALLLATGFLALVWGAFFLAV